MQQQEYSGFPREQVKRALYNEGAFIMDVLNTPEAEEAIRCAMREDGFPMRLIGPMLVHANGGKPLERAQRIVSGALLAHVVTKRLKLGQPGKLVRQYGRNAEFFVNWRHYIHPGEDTETAAFLAGGSRNPDDSDSIEAAISFLPTAFLERVRTAIVRELHGR